MEELIQSVQSGAYPSKTGYGLAHYLHIICCRVCLERAIEQISCAKGRFTTDRDVSAIRVAMAASTSAALSFANLAAARSSSLTGSPVSSVKASGSSRASAPLACRAQKAGEGEVPAPPVSRRAVISIAAAAAAAVAAITAPIHPADAAYGEEANIFGAVKVETGFVTYKGNGFKVDIPSRWGPSKEVEFPGTVLRYEDNFDSLSNLAVMVIPDGNTSIKDYGSPEKFLESMAYLLGKQSYSGKTQSEGGFDKDAVATAAILESSTPVINGKDYYSIQVLTRTADGGEGGRHQLFVATVSGGKLYLLKTQAGDKRWFKGTRKYIEGIANSFSVA